jgi:CheY-like chemotaxis protein
MSNTTAVKSPASPCIQAKNLREAELFDNIIHKLGHEIGNPLTSIISLATILERFEKEDVEKDTERLQQYAKSITKEAWRVAHVAQQMVMLFTTKSSCDETCNILETFERFYKRFKSRSNVEDVHLSVNIDPSVEASIDSEQLIFLFTELLKNAIDAASLTNSKNITIATSAKDNNILLTIENDCLKPSETELQTLFEPFASNSGGKKLGLGLTVALAILERHGGQIQIQENTLDNSQLSFSTFVQLPGNNTSRKTKKNSSLNTLKEKTASIENPFSVLLIDDDEMVSSAVQKILSLLLPTCNYNCLDGTEAVQKLNAGACYDVILCDIHLGNMSGTDIYKLVKDSDQLAHFAFVSGGSISEEVNSFLNSCGRPYLKKPFETNELIDLVIQLHKGC